MYFGDQPINEAIKSLFLTSEREKLYCTSSPFMSPPAPFLRLPLLLTSLSSKHAGTAGSPTLHFYHANSINSPAANMPPQQTSVTELPMHNVQTNAPAASTQLGRPRFSMSAHEIFNGIKKIAGFTAIIIYFMVVFLYHLVFNPIRMLGRFDRTLSRAFNSSFS